MPNITIRDIPDTLYQDIKTIALKERRSVNSQIIQGLAEYLTHKKSTTRLLNEIRIIHENLSLKGFKLSPSEMKSIIEEGRS
ncbi:MAG: hypothetical protein HN580_03220 [Deltaproteobacteria bacterium]|nr:hypothetical protein [Deltaproteobacteria bacterium]MBT7888005.1 hypothetical protein [Deltaproteobacteria bacterium]